MISLNISNMRLFLILSILLISVWSQSLNDKEEKNDKEVERESRNVEEIIVTEDENLLTPEQLDAQDEPLRSTLNNGPLSQTVTELGGRPILSQAFDLGKASAQEPYRIVRRERLRLPTYVHDILSGVTPQPIPLPLPPYPYPYPPPYGPYGLPYPYPPQVPPPFPVGPQTIATGRA